MEPGSTSLDPNMGAPKARAQEFAWNIGTIARTVVALVRQQASGMDIVKDCRKLALCEYSTPCMHAKRVGQEHCWKVCL